MIDSIGLLWSLMTVFFDQAVLDFPLFQALILFNTIFGTFYLIRYIFSTLSRV